MIRNCSDAIPLVINYQLSVSLQQPGEKLFNINDFYCTLLILWHNSDYVLHAEILFVSFSSLIWPYFHYKLQIPRVHRPSQQQKTNYPTTCRGGLYRIPPGHQTDGKLIDSGSVRSLVCSLVYSACPFIRSHKTSPFLRAYRTSSIREQRVPEEQASFVSLRVRLVNKINVVIKVGKTKPPQKINWYFISFFGTCPRYESFGRHGWGGRGVICFYFVTFPFVSISSTVLASMIVLVVIKKAPHPCCLVRREPFAQPNKLKWKDC